MITVLADQHLYKIKEIMPEAIDLRFYDPEEGFSNRVEEADALLIRTVSDLNRATLPEIPDRLRFAASGSAGTDHVDIGYLEANDVRFAHSAGCNAQAVAEYVVTALIIWSETHKVDLSVEPIGIVGAGHVGSALKQLLDRMGWSYLLYDPPRAEREDGFSSVTRKELLECPILSFHTPLHRNTPYATHHWLDREKLAERRFKMVINTARGGIVEEEALLQAGREGRLESMILDVWENEPVFSDRSAEEAFIATPHIAGYSEQAKYRATAMIVDQMLAHFRIDLQVPAPSRSPQRIALSSDPDERLTAGTLLKQLHPIENYFREFRKLIGCKDARKGRKFNNLRTSMPFRNEFAHLEIPADYIKAFPLLKKLGLKGS